jgi:two-component system, chemotaxis family, sensor kinase CheA
MSMDKLRDTFFAECDELIEGLTEGLEVIASEDWDKETINSIFRAVHSIKGAAGAFALSDLVTFSHRFETVLDLIRSQNLVIDGEVLRVITRSGDVLAELIDYARVESNEVPSAMLGLIGELEELSGAGSTAKTEDSATEPEHASAFAFVPLALLPVGQLEFSVFFKPTTTFFSNGHEPEAFFHALEKLGDISAHCRMDELPDLTALNPSESYLAWDITVKGAAGEEDIREVFQFAEGLCELEISALSADEPEESPFQILADPSSEDALGKLDTGAPTQPEATVAVVQAPPSRKETPAAVVQATLRVDPERVDRLINTVGELIINQSVISQNLIAAGFASNSEIMAALDDYTHLAREIQEGVMSIRAQPVKSLFQRMARVVREAAEATGKQVVLVTEGESTEIDKTVIERLSDPLTHMLRNAVDHGIEPPDRRDEAGKARTGTVRLAAAHKSGHVQIEISDDGAGVNREKVLAKAIKNGLVPPDAKLSDAEIDALLFAPGFSTSEQVTNLSGRGVGMDVVKTSLTALGGRVGISSQLGRGSSFTITLPLTMAVLDGMLVDVGTETLVLPISSIRETVRARPQDIRRIGLNDVVLSVRGTYVPVVDLGRILDMAADRRGDSVGGGTFVLVTGDDGATLAVAVDAISDQRQVVIKSLEGNYGAIAGISAATILGSGKVALIVDTDALFKLVGGGSFAPVFAEMES